LSPNWSARSISARPAFWPIAQLDANAPLLSHALFARAILTARTLVGLTARFGLRFVAGTAAGFWPPVTFSTSLALCFWSAIAGRVAIGVPSSCAITVGILASIALQLTNTVSQPAKPFAQRFARCGEFFII
jgi:hypothetical protein